MNSVANAQDELIELVGRYYADLGGYLRMAYPWGESGTELEGFAGPERWVMEVADDISNQVAKNEFHGSMPVPCVYVAIASGNGCAKSAFAGMINSWIQSTRPMSRVTVTANTGDQLRTKTWPEIEKWARLSITGDWFDIGAESMRHKVEGAKWATNSITWNVNRPQAFAGQHARQASSCYIWDESSGIPEIIMGEADGGLTDGEPFWIMLGNPTNRGGRLFRAVFGDLKWNGSEGQVPPPGEFISRSIDSRSCLYTNKDKIERWARERGEDSDWFRAHVRGLAPEADEMQYIDLARVEEAQKRPTPASDESEPLAMAIDFARGGSAWNVVAWRRGRDMRSIPRKRIPGESTRDTTLMVSFLLQEIQDKKPDIVFGDATGIGGPIMDRMRQLVKHVPIVDVVNGGKAPDDRPNNPSYYGNWRAYCWGRMREWLPGGCIEADDKLKDDLTQPGYYHNLKDQLMLESKDDMVERGLASPDDGDACAMTFAQPVMPKRDPPKVTRPGYRPQTQRTQGRGWMRK